MKTSVFKRCAAKAVVTADALPFAAAAVYNPGAALYEDHIVLLLRVEDAAGYSSIYVARSADGVADWEIEPEPFLKHGQEPWRYEEWGCEDGRATFMAEANCWYVTYTAYSPAGPAIGLARSKDFVMAERVCLLPFSDDKDGVFFPQRFAGEWLMLHRPNAGLSR